MMRAFFSNGGYATWFQSLVVVISVAVAAWAIRQTDINMAVSNSVGLAQRYFTERPPLASANLRLRISQYMQVQEAKKSFAPRYDPQMDQDYSRLFEVAQPLVSKEIIEKTSLQDDYNALNDFFSAVLICVENTVCDRATTVKLLAWEILGYYNAVCPFMKEGARKYGRDEDSPRYLGFLLTVYDDRKMYFCRGAFSS
jgi:hypothetical protein